MNYDAIARTDVGIRKKTNQDSALILTADTEIGFVMLALICDGMGGLAKGELASATVIRAFSDWFKNRLPKLLRRPMTANVLKSEWNALILEQNQILGDYGEDSGIRLGTTVAGMLVINDTYYVVNVGDSRVYEITDKVTRITKDQTYIQREMDLGHMTYEQAMKDPQRNVLLQCVGASEIVIPDYYIAPVKQNACYMLCSDGFRHVISEDELKNALCFAANPDKKAMGDHVAELIELNKRRNEKDNITAILIRTY